MKEKIKKTSKTQKIKKQYKTGNSTTKKKVQCSPQLGKINKFTCYSDVSLYKLRDLWNSRHPDNLIKTNEPKEIWVQLYNLLQNVCNTESCWINQNFIDETNKELLKDSFAPISPTSWKLNPYEWLSSVDILNVMKQYEKAYKCFEFMGPSPINYDTRQLYGEPVWSELAYFNLKEQISRGKNKIGIIFNLDPHYKSGSHWVSLFINIKKKSIYYFDSVGEKIPYNIMKFVKNVQNQGLQQNILFKFDQNHPIVHQYTNTECGVYSLFFICHMIEDKITGDYLKTHIIKDKYIKKFRKIYFNSNNIYKNKNYKKTKSKI